MTKKTSRPVFFLLLAVLVNSLLVACGTFEKLNRDTAAADQKTKAYVDTIERYSGGDKDYNGFYNMFDFHATLMNTVTEDAAVKRQADFYQWDEVKLEKEMVKTTESMNIETIVFCSFFTPDRRNDNLIDSKSVWRVFLDSGGKRYTAKIRRSHKMLAELQNLYPFHTRWTTGYVFTFPVPVSQIERQKSTLTITGPLGSRSVDFTAIAATQ